MVQVNKRLNGGDNMDECFKQRKLLANEFKNFQKVFIALGDETRQQIFMALLENDTVENCWNGLSMLIDHVNKVICSANNHGYPNFKEE